MINALSTHSCIFALAIFFFKFHSKVHKLGPKLIEVSLLTLNRICSCAMFIAAPPTSDLQKQTQSHRKAKIPHAITPSISIGARNSPAHLLLIIFPQVLGLGRLLHTESVSATQDHVRIGKCSRALLYKSHHLERH